MGGKQGYWSMGVQLGLQEAQIDDAAATSWAGRVAPRSRWSGAGVAAVEGATGGLEGEARASRREASADRGTVDAIICAPWDCFRQGYQDFGGNPEWEDRFVDVIDTCESRNHKWDDTYPLYASRAQFHPDSWRRVVDATGLSDPASPYHVGGNVAWWSNAIDPGGTGGWPVCWWRGIAPADGN